MGTVHGLKISLGIPIAVIEDNNVCGGQVDTEPPGSGRKQEDKLVAIRSVVLVNSGDTILMTSAPVDTAIFWRTVRITGDYIKGNLLYCLK
jgi:hypothetical protein